MAEKFQVSKKFDDGTIIVVGGDSATEFAQNLAALGGDTLRDEVRALFYNLIPAAAPAPAVPTMAQAQANVVQAFPDATPVEEPWADDNQGGGEQPPTCPVHRLPAKWVPPGVSKRTNKPYSGFWSCSQNDRNCRIGR